MYLKQSCRPSLFARPAALADKGEPDEVALQPERTWGFWEEIPSPEIDFGSDSYSNIYIYMYI